MSYEQHGGFELLQPLPEQWGAGGGGGGFEQDDGAGSSGAAAAAAASEQPKKRQERRLTPVTIKMILEAQWDGRTGNYKGMELSEVSLVGYVMNQNERATSIEYELEDSTGAMRGQLYSEDGAPVDHVQGKYVKVIARVLSGDGGQSAPRLVFESVRALPLDDDNEITLHYTSAIHAFLVATRGALKQPQENEAVAAAAAPSSSSSRADEAAY